ncbi:hypothetical protein BJY52DRAFT_1217181 [Lactarius psammicola]|nr:hypothetical protein BJY52DRAFT_1217181 [Lactarius psammicola]
MQPPSPDLLYHYPMLDFSLSPQDHRSLIRPLRDSFILIPAHSLQPSSLPSAARVSRPSPKSPGQTSTHYTRSVLGCTWPSCNQSADLSCFDALVPRRDEALSESSSRVVNTLLTELDAWRCVFILGATNRPDMLDPTICRPRQLDRLHYVDLPSADERAKIVRTLLVRRHVLPIMVGGVRGEGYSGADLAALVREAGVRALRRALGTLREMDDDPAGPESDPEGVVVLVEDL